jgi:hypothetical protein
MQGGKHTGPSSVKATSYRHNFLAFLGEGTLFGIGIQFANTTTVLPGFVSQLGGGAVLVGLIVSINQGLWRLPQLVFANFLTNKPRKKPWLTRAGITGRPAYLLYAIALWFGLGHHPSAALALFFFAHALFYTNMAMDSVVWWDVFAKAIPGSRRGRLLGLATALRGVFAIGTGYLIAWMLGKDGPPFPFNYTTLFALSGACFLLSLASWIRVIEPEEPVERQRTAWRDYLKQMSDIFRHNGAFRWVVLTRLLAGLDGLSLGLYTIFAIRIMGFSTASLGLFTAVQTVGSILAGVLFGVISERFGTHRIIQLGTLFSLSAPLVALGFLLFGPPDGLVGNVLYSWVFLAVGVFLTTNFIGFSNYVIELAPPGHRGTHIGLFNTMTGVLVIWPAVGGWLLEQTSYLVLFSVTAGCLLLAHGLSWGLPAIHRLPSPWRPGTSPRR